ncbi:Fructose-bisphosphate aldolase OS=Streptomyces microflavus OX=1919 GN=fbaA PE=3 SV=1 [Streptomyces microflavus]
MGWLGRDPRRQPGHWPGSAKAAAAKIILEVEITPTGGEEDGVTHEINDELYTTVDDALRTAEALGLGEKGRYLLAASFGNVHGVYKPGNVVLRPELLKDLQSGVSAKYWASRPAASRSTSSSTAVRAPPPRRSPPRWRTAS